MIERVRVTYFKKYVSEVFDISGNVVLAGPNNSGKSTVLQAIAAWNLARQKWMAARGLESGSRPQKKLTVKKRAGVPIPRKEFTAIPLREMNLLWTNRSTSILKHEEEYKAGKPRHLEIELIGGEWKLAFEFIYGNTELVYVKPNAYALDDPDVFDKVRDVRIVHVPPFSGIGAEEMILTPPAQDYIIGQNKPGDVLRNQLVEVYTENRKKWDTLCEDIEEIFGVELQPPKHEGLPFIVCEYRDGSGVGRNLVRLDISSAGSGFLQVLMLFGFLYARPASVLLLDEPDAHLHVILQKQIFEKLKKISVGEQCQLIIATHSEVLVDGTAPEWILSFFKKPHRLISEIDRDRVREALKRLTNMDILSAERAKGILYVEGETDINLLREWAVVLNHEAKRLFSKGLFWYTMNGRNPQEAKNHFFALREVKPDIKAVILLDGDNRTYYDHDVGADNMTVLRWKRYEAESYLLHPIALARYVEGTPPDLFKSDPAKRGVEYLRNELPPAVFNNPLAEHPFLNREPASKILLPEFFKAAGVSLPKKEYYQIASQMLPEEIPEEVREKLDAIYKQLGNPENLAEE
jgi:predicted ATPase